MLSFLAGLILGTIFGRVYAHKAFVWLRAEIRKHSVS
jgi:hypothetical protein